MTLVLILVVMDYSLVLSKEQRDAVDWMMS